MSQPPVTHVMPVHPVTIPSIPIPIPVLEDFRRNGRESGRQCVEDRQGYAIMSYALDMLCYSIAMLPNYVVCNSDTKISLW